MFVSLFYTQESSNFQSMLPFLRQCSCQGSAEAFTDKHLPPLSIFASSLHLCLLSPSDPLCLSTDTNDTKVKPSLTSFPPSQNVLLSRAPCPPATGAFGRRAPTAVVLSLHSSHSILPVEMWTNVCSCDCVPACLCCQALLSLFDLCPTPCGPLAAEKSISGCKL